MNISSTLGSAFLATALIGGAAQAATFDLSILNVTGSWTASELSNGGEATSQAGGKRIAWGSPVNGKQQSSYQFDGGDATTVQSEQEVVLGEFTHRNYPIYEPTLLNAQLTVNIDASVGSEFFTLTSVFEFDHNETPNTPGTCLPGSVTVCDDVVTATLNQGASTFFAIGDDSYFFDVTGFMVNGVLFDSFLTAENAMNSAFLVGQFTATPGSGIEGGDDNLKVTPLPAAAWFLISSIAGLGFVGRRRK